MDANEHARIIVEEKDPYLREIYALGYTRIDTIPMENKLILFQDREVKKEIDLSDFRQLLYKLTIKSGIMPDGEKHEWISEADGSADRFREFIGEPKTLG